METHILHRFMSVALTVRLTVMLLQSIGVLLVQGAHIPSQRCRLLTL